MRSVIFLAIGLFLLVSQRADAQWAAEKSGTLKKLTEISFLNETVVVHFLRKGADGEWKKVLLSHPGCCHSIAPISDTEALAVGARDTVFRTVDGGLTWIAEYSPNANGGGYGFSAMIFVNDSTGHAPGYKTTDGGRSWELKHKNLNWFPYIPQEMVFTSADTGFVAGWAYWGKIYKTTDGGESWNEMKVPAETWEIYDIHFPAPQVGYAVSLLYGDPKRPEILKTTDAGENWHSIHLGDSILFNAIHCTDTNTCYVAGNSGLILKTEDGGLTWNKENSGTAEHLHGISFLDKLTGYAVGANGTILRFDGNTNTIAENIPEHTIAVYPNPSAGIFKVQIDKEPGSGVTVEVYNLAGQKLLIQSAAMNSLINLESYPSGIYFYKITGSNGNISAGKLIKQ